MINKHWILGKKTTIIAPELESNYVALKDAWPKYPLDEYRFRLADSPIMMINGQLDAATPLDFAAHLASLTSETRTLYVIPLSGHVVPYFTVTTTRECPLHLILSWAFPSLFPTEWSNAACIKDLPITIDFVGVTELTRASSRQFLNISLPFGNPNASALANHAAFHSSIALLIFICSSLISIG